MGEICPRSANHRPDDFPAADCVAAGECGCKTPEEHYAMGRIAGLKEAADIIEQYMRENAPLTYHAMNFARSALEDIQARVSSSAPRPQD